MAEGLKPRLRITAKTGATVTASFQGETVALAEVETGIYEGDVDRLAPWVVTDGTVTTTVNVNDVARFEMELLEKEITANNISNYFTVSNGSYYFAGSGSVWTSNNKGVKSSTATTSLTALRNMTVSFHYSYSSEANYDKFSLTFAGVPVESGASGTTTQKEYTAEIKAGEVIKFEYVKDSSQDSNDDQCTFSQMTVM